MFVFLLIISMTGLIITSVALSNITGQFIHCDIEKDVSLHTCKIIKIVHHCPKCLYFIDLELENGIMDQTRLNNINYPVILTNHSYECWQFTDREWYRYTFNNPSDKDCIYYMMILKVVGISILLLICVISLLFIISRCAYKIVARSNNEQNISDISSLINWIRINK
jgi:hypothetical protein